jgi:hypothetical protein
VLAGRVEPIGALGMAGQLHDYTSAPLVRSGIGRLLRGRRDCTGRNKAGAMPLELELIHSHDRMSEYVVITWLLAGLSRVMQFKVS